MSQNPCDSPYPSRTVFMGACRRRADRFEPDWAAQPQSCAITVIIHFADQTRSRQGRGSSRGAAAGRVADLEPQFLLREVHGKIPLACSRCRCGEHVEATQRDMGWGRYSRFAVRRGAPVLAHQVDQGLLKRGHDVIGLTSARAAEGPSTLAAAMATATATSGRRTLSIDGDLRNPTSTRLLECVPLGVNRKRTICTVGWVKAIGRDPTFPGKPRMLGRATLDPTYVESALAPDHAPGR